MNTTLIGASDVRYEKEGQQRQFYVLRCLAPAKSYGKSKTENLGLEQKDLFVDAEVYNQVKNIKRFPVEVELLTETDLFINRVDVKGIRAVS